MNIGAMKLSTKIGTGFTILNVLILILGTVSFVEFYITSRHSARIYEHALQMEQVSDLRGTIQRIPAVEMDYLLTGKSQSGAQFADICGNVEEQLLLVKAGSLSDKESALLKELERMYVEVKQSGAELFAKKGISVDGQMSILKKNHDAQSQNTMIEATESIHLLIKDDMQAFLAGSRAANNRMALVIVMLIIISISSGYVIAKRAVNQIAAVSAEILAASQQEAAAAQEQSSAVAETTAAATELSKSAEMVGENIKRVAQVTNHTLAGMAKIREAIDRTGKIVSALSEKSQKIGKITEVIDDVADQTNLLAVNAAIEAARAGEHGAGFTVVADEIRKLSDSTAKSTKDITDLIELIQHEVSNAIAAMEQSSLSVEEEVKLAQESADRAREISMSVTQQVGGSKQIADAMTNINEAMKQIAAGAQQAQSAARQLNGIGGK